MNAKDHKVFFFVILGVLNDIVVQKNILLPLYSSLHNRHVITIVVPLLHWSMIVQTV